MTPKERNVLWMTEQKPQCMACKHVILKWPAMRCGMSPLGNGRNLYSAHNYCIDAREKECVGGVMYEANVGIEPPYSVGSNDGLGR